MHFQCNNSLLFGNSGSSCLEFIGVKLTTPVENTTAGCSGGEGGPHAREGCEAEWDAGGRWSGTAEHAARRRMVARVGDGASGWRQGHAAWAGVSGRHVVISTV
jgi:hypothetical protein